MLEEVNQELQKQIIKHHSEEALRGAYDELERQVEERTAELLKANEALKEQIAARRQVEDKLRRQNEYLTALHETSLDLMNRLELTDLLEAILVRAGALMNIPNGNIFLLEPGETEMVTKIGIGVSSKIVGDRIKLGEGLVGRVWQTGQPLVLEDYHTWPGRIPDPRRDDLRAVVGIPLKSGSEVVGVIGLNSTEEGRIFGDEEIELLSRFAELASIALDNSRVHNELERRVEERTIELSKANTILKEQIAERKQAEEKLRRQNEYLEALHETTLGLMNRLELTEVLETIVQRAGALVGTSNGFINLVEPGGVEMVTKVGVGVNSKFVGQRMKRGEGLGGKIWQTGQPMIVEDYSTWPNRLPDPGFNITHAHIGVPLKSGSEIIGMIGLTSIEEGRTFGEEEVTILSRFAQLASIALENAGCTIRRSKS